MKRPWIGAAAFRLTAALALIVGGVAVGSEPGPSPPAGPLQPHRLRLSKASFYWRAPAEVRELKLNDLVVVLVDEKSQVISEGEMDRRKKADGDFILKEWLALDGLSIVAAPQTSGDPAAEGEMQSKYRTESELETRDAMKFRIACRVVDIRPNGNLVIEGRRSIHNNGDVWEMSLLGAIRPEDVLPNNTVLSENVAELRIVKREKGHVRDGYRRGWFQRCLDWLQPF